MIIKRPNYFENIYRPLWILRNYCCSSSDFRQIDMFRAEDSDCLVFDFIYKTGYLFDYMKKLFINLDKEQKIICVRDRASMFIIRRSNMKSRDYTIIDNLNKDCGKAFLVYPVYGNRILHISSNTYKYMGIEKCLYFSKHIPPYIIEVEDNGPCGCIVYIRYNLGADTEYKKVYENFISCH